MDFVALISELGQVERTTHGNIVSLHGMWDDVSGDAKKNTQCIVFEVVLA